MPRKVIILTTGGTVSQQSNRDGVAEAGFDPRQLALKIACEGVELEFRQVLQKGSKDIVPNDWKTIATAAAKAIEEDASGIVILHGTDTMHYTAAALSFMLQNLGVPIVLTGSMIPGGDSESDSLSNLRDAIRVAAYADVAEVCIVFSADAERTRGVIIRGNRAKKIHSYAINAFASINAPPIGYVTDTEIIVPGSLNNRGSRFSLSVNTDLDPNVALVKLNPGMTAENFSRALGGASGAVLEGTGTGHIKSDLYDVIMIFGKPTLITTQATYGGEWLGMYAGDRAVLNIANILLGGDMTSETGLVKLMWALRQRDLNSIMRANLAGEMSPRMAGK